MNKNTEFSFKHINCINCHNKLVIDGSDRNDYLCINCGTSNKSQMDYLRASADNAMKDYEVRRNEAYYYARNRTIEMDISPTVTSAQGEALGNQSANEFLDTWQNGSKLKALFRLFFPTSMTTQSRNKRRF